MDKQKFKRHKYVIDNDFWKPDKHNKLSLRLVSKIMLYHISDELMDLNIECCCCFAGDLIFRYKISWYPKILDILGDVY